MALIASPLGSSGRWGRPHRTSCCGPTSSSPMLWCSGSSRGPSC